MRRKYASLLLLTISLAATAQPSRIPVLKQQLAQSTASARTDTTRSRLLCELGEQYAEVNLDSCFFYLTQSLRTAQRVRDSVGTARAMYQLGRTHLFYTKDEGKATDYFRQALAVATPINNYACLANCYSLLATVSYHQHIGNAEELLRKALAYAQKSRNNKTIADVYDICYLESRRLDPTNFRQQQYLLKQAMAASLQSDPDFYVTMGLDYCEVLTKNGKHGEALSMARRLDAQTSRLQKTQGEFVYTCDMGRLLGFLKKYEQAGATMVNGIAAEKRRPHPDSAHLYHYCRFLLDMYGEQKAWQKAYHTRDTLATLELWLQTKRQTRDAKLQMTQQKAAFDLEERDNQIKLLDARQQQQQLLLAGAVLVAVLLVGFAIVQHRNQQRIEQQRAELTQLNATKDKLFAILSHDLRSPVSALSNFLALHNWGLLPKAEFDQSIAKLTDRVAQVRTLLDNVLNWSLTQLGGLHPQPERVLLEPLIANKFQIFQPMADAKGINLYQLVPQTVSLYVDKDQLKIIVRNLLQNAIKFTHSGGQVTVQYAESEGSCELIVADTGIGIPPDLLPKLFLLEAKTSQPGTANEPGTGLGLVLVKELTEANGGQVAVESQVGTGSTFTVRFSRKGVFANTTLPMASEIALSA